MALYIVSETVRRVDQGGGTYGWAHRTLSEYRRKAEAIAEADALPGKIVVWRQHDNATIHDNGREPRTVDMMDRQYW
jgi:hypothetical protein